MNMVLVAVEQAECSAEHSSESNKGSDAIGLVAECMLHAARVDDPELYAASYCCVCMQ